jgi:hypothetical protein
MSAVIIAILQLTVAAVFVLTISGGPSKETWEERVVNWPKARLAGLAIVALSVATALELLING